MIGLGDNLAGNNFTALRFYFACPNINLQSFHGYAVMEIVIVREGNAEGMVLYRNY